MSRIAMIVWNEFRNDARVLKEAQTLQGAGYDVTVFALHTPGVTLEHEILEGGIKVSRVARSPFWKLRKAKTSSGQVGGNASIGRLSPARQVLRIAARMWTHGVLAARIAMHRADVVHAHDVNTLPTAWFAAKISGARVIYDAHEISTSREGYDSFRRLVGVVEKLLMPRVQGTITTTDARAKFFSRAYGISRPVVLQNRPRLTFTQSSQRIREQLGLTETWPIILYQGGLQQGRGLERLVRLVARVPEAYFVFIGGGRLTQPLISLSQELALTDRVHFIPTVSLADLPDYTASADIGVQPIENTCLNHFTTDSNKLFEYLIAGLPVVATDFPEIRRIVRAHDVGLLVREGDDQMLADALKVLVRDSNLRLRLANNARSASMSLNWEDQQALLIDLYNRVLPAESARVVTR
ncbi:MULTISPECIES: glycosyltransferase family 4 protein [unclassified Pseudomonas]|uniref:glycosyltransferase family 4 protein n=1 Tax=unclassified Pseudomonas TaxID=196821 RepID=UPI001032D846|nr:MULTISPECIES: glycosyltransferase family 4 protein [unclassified Pseudomonas]